MRAYAEEVEHYRSVRDDTERALTLDAAEGAVLDALHRAKLLDAVRHAGVDDGRRGLPPTLRGRLGVRRLEEPRWRRCEAFASTWGPARTNRGTVTFDVLDVVGRSGVRHRQRRAPGLQHPHRGLQRGPGQRRGAVDEAGQGRGAEQGGGRRPGPCYFEHHGHRTAISQRALQAHADRFLGLGTLPGEDGPVGTSSARCPLRG